jgi:hypothetical protein
MKKKAMKKAKRNSHLWWIGVWATTWWGVSGLYVLLLAWMAKPYYVEDSMTGPMPTDMWADWSNAITRAYTESEVLRALLWVILLVWVIGGIKWLMEIRRQRISYAAAFKDLLLTVRR